MLINAIEETDLSREELEKMVAAVMDQLGNSHVYVVPVHTYEIV